MNQPPQSVPPHGVRPQLFGGSTGNSAHHPIDFGPSILATIDGGKPRLAAASRRSHGQRSLVWLAAAVVVGGISYAGMNYFYPETSAQPTLDAKSPTSAVVPAAPASASTPSMVDAHVPKTAGMAGAVPALSGAAAIETTASVPEVNKSISDEVVTAPPNVASEPALSQVENIGVIRSAANNAEQSRPAKVAKTSPVKKTVLAEKKPSTSRDTDADLLAAMLPHLTHLQAQSDPRSPAFDKRCGQLSGDAALDCRAKFCNGRQGSDAACPSPAASAP